MPLFHFRARNSHGDAVEGEVEAGSAELVATQLINGGNTPVDIQEIKPKRDILGELRERLGAGKPQLDDLILYCRQMYTLTRAGVPIVRAINGLAETARSPVLGEILRTVRTELESGRELSSAMAHHPDVFSSLMVSMVQVGENTGRLDEAFLQLAQHLEMEKDTRDRVKSAVRYPMFVIFAIGVAITIINIWVIPAFAKVFSGFHMELPWQTRLLIGISNFMVAYWPYLLAGLGGMVIGARYYVQTDQGRYNWDKLKLRLPIVGDIILRAILARFARAFAMSTRSGVPLVQALTVVGHAVGNSYVTDRILSMRNGIERGDTLTRTASVTGLFTPLVLQMLAVGEETGQVDEMLDEVGGFYEREVDYDLKNLATAIEPILIVAVGILVLILALGVFLPMWDLTQIARQ
jgi:MSHA biogenesis protein MshG